MLAFRVSRFGLRFSMGWSAILSYILLFLFLVFLLYNLGISLWISPIAAFFVCVIHFLSETWHQVGHAIFAKQTGYPMNGIHYWFLLASSLYPRNEVLLPPETHLHRAWGGPFFSFSLTIIFAFLALGYALLWHTSFNNIILGLLLFGLMDNLLVFTLGALMPISLGNFKSDGSVILYWRRKLKK